jgi:putative iron-dependent peroxidase
MSSTLTPQSGILPDPPPAARFLTFGLATGADPAAAFECLAALRLGERTPIGVGDPLLRMRGRALAGLRPFPALSSPGGAFPSTQGAVWACLGGADPGEVLHRAIELVGQLAPALRVDEDVATFVFAGGRDLSGYEDGTENPKADRAREVALVPGAAAGLGAGSFVAVQRWVHDLALLRRLSQGERDHIVGRDAETNEELAEAPAAAHVKRSAQESFEPTAFMLRRSMPYGTVSEHGLYFVAYGATLDAFERVLRRMAGLDDGIVDGLLRFTRPVTGGYYFCPPAIDGRLDLRAIA